jgi:hypothetical protein
VIFNGSVFPDPEGVIQILREQAADLKKPPKTFDDILCALAVPAWFCYYYPEFNG